MSENKIKFGLKNVYRAPVNDNNGVITYGTPIAMPGAVTLSLKGVTEVVDIAADDDPEYARITQNKGYEGDIEFQIFSDRDRVDVLGAILDSNGCIVEGEDDEPKQQALMFEFDGDTNKTRHVLYNCFITKPDIESGTKGEKTENKTDKLAIKAKPAKDTRKVKYKTTSNTPTNIYNNWFTSVQLPNLAQSTQITPDDVVFDKKSSNQADVNITLIKAGSETLTSIKENNVAISASTDYSITGNVVTIKKAYLAALSVGVHNLVFEFSAGASRTLEVRIINTGV